MGVIASIIYLIQIDVSKLDKFHRLVLMTALKKTLSGEEVV